MPEERACDASDSSDSSTWRIGDANLEVTQRGPRYTMISYMGDIRQQKKEE